MNKFEVITFPQNIDTSNPYGLDELTVVDISRVPYNQNMTLNKGEYTFDTDEDAYWIFPGFRSDAPAESRGYIRFRDNDVLISAGDEIEISFAIAITSILNNRTGVTVDILDASNALLGALSFFPKSVTPDGYTYYKETKRINPAWTNARNFRLVVGTVGSPNDAVVPYKIKDVQSTVKRNTSSQVKTESPSLYGLGTTLTQTKGLIDNATTHPTSGARNVNLKSGVYPLLGLTDSGGDGKLNGNGTLFVSPYRGNTGVHITHLAMINERDSGDGVYRRTYNPVRGSFSDWVKLPLVVNVPTSPTSAGRVGNIAFDSNYFYYCYENNKWARVAKGSW